MATVSAAKYAAKRLLQEERESPVTPSPDFVERTEHTESIHMSFNPLNDKPFLSQTSSTATSRHYVENAEDAELVSDESDGMGKLDKLAEGVEEALETMKGLSEDAADFFNKF